MLTGLLAALATWLAVPEAPAARLRRMAAPVERPRMRRWSVTPVVGLGLAAAGSVVVVLGPAGIGWATAAGVATGTLAWIVTSRVEARQARTRAADVAGAARVLAALLRSGQIPTAALREVADDHPSFVEAAAAAELGGDVAGAFERGACLPGAGGLRTVAAAWRVSERSGAPVAGVLERVAETLREEQRVRGVVEAELAAARASGHIMALLPFGAVGLGFLAGGNPLEFLFGPGLGQWLATVAVLLTAVGVTWIERLARA